MRHEAEKKATAREKKANWNLRRCSRIVLKSWTNNSSDWSSRLGARPCARDNILTINKMHQQMFSQELHALCACLLTRLRSLQLISSWKLTQASSNVKAGRANTKVQFGSTASVKQSMLKSRTHHKVEQIKTTRWKIYSNHALIAFCSWIFVTHCRRAEFVATTKCRALGGRLCGIDNSVSLNLSHLRSLMLVFSTTPALQISYLNVNGFNSSRLYKLSAVSVDFWKS